MYVGEEGGKGGWGPTGQSEVLHNVSSSEDRAKTCAGYVTLETGLTGQKYLSDRREWNGQLGLHLR